MDIDRKIAELQKKSQDRKENTNKLSEDSRDINDNSVTKSNALARGYYRFSLPEKRVMESMISRLDPRRMDNDFQDIELRAKDYAQAFNVQEHNAYIELNTAVKSLVKKTITIDLGKQNVKEYPLMSEAFYQQGKGKITASFNPKLIPHIQGLKKKFCSYPLNTAKHFKSSYTWRFYEVLISWAKPKEITGENLAGWMTIDLEQLQKMLGAPESYKWIHFKTKALDKAINELRDKANMHVAYKTQKTGRKITKLQITFAEYSNGKHNKL